MSTFVEAPAGDAQSGEKLFKSKCSFCHTLEKGGAHKMGPNLAGLLGKKAGQAAGYDYSVANKNSEVVWSEDTLYEYLLNPKEYMPGTKKPFHGVKKEQDRADLIAYLKKNAKGSEDAKLSEAGQQRLELKPLR
ncbi:hypothetical protein R1sor_010671 [Riccia sorocarpa]|uniref:Cytochrome c domain-containing protein n=1 Tax=Riccia sorocarpa TaxID=122646 RepID=A0ABD3I2A5_9MARC